VCGNRRISSVFTRKLLDSTTVELLVDILQCSLSNVAAYSVEWGF
jgi:hypothetical protein